MRNKKQKNVIVTVTGDAFLFDRYWYPQPYRARRKGAAYYNDDDYDDSELTSEELAAAKKRHEEYLGVRLRRRKGRFIAALCNIKLEPKYFLTLMIPRNQRPFKDRDEERELFLKFVRLLRYRYPHCWFIYKVEWSNTAKIHYHLIGDFTGPRALPRLALPQIKREVKRLWETAIGVSAANSVDLLFYDERHKSYLTTREKFKKDIRCLDILRGGRMWNYINKGQISFHKRVVFKLTPQEFTVFSIFIDAYFLNRYPDAIGHYIQLRRSRGRVSYVPREVIMAACRYAKSRRWRYE